MIKRWKDRTRLTKLMVIAPLAILGMVLFAWVGGEVVKLLWNWLAPDLLGLARINFWQALGLLALCRILFGGFGPGGGGNRSSRRMNRRISERIDERWEQMTPEERERFRQGFDRAGRTSPLDSNQTA